MEKLPVQRVEKPWGYEIIYAANELYVGKILFIRKGEALSLQYHAQKDETLYVHEGLVEFVTMEESADDGHGHPNTMLLKEGEGVRIPPGLQHRLTALKDTRVLEVSSPYLYDIVRLEDRYGRV